MDAFESMHALMTSGAEPKAAGIAVVRVPSTSENETQSLQDVSVQ